MTTRGTPRGDAQYIRGSITRAWCGLNSNAKTRGIDVYITREEFASLIFANYCFHCGCSRFEFGNRLSNPGKPRVTRFVMIYLGIDRRDSGLSYTVDNCVPCCPICQSAKMAMPEVRYHKWLGAIRAR